jgi:hypothetical protein
LGVGRNRQGAEDESEDQKKAAGSYGGIAKSMLLSIFVSKLVVRHGRSVIGLAWLVKKESPKRTFASLRILQRCGRSFIRIVPP